MSSLPPPIPPATSAAARTGTVAEASGSFTLGSACSDAFSLLSRQYLLLLGATAVWFVILLVASFLPLVGSIAAVFTGPFYCKLILLAVRANRNLNPRVSEIFDVFNSDYWPLLAIYLLVSLASVIAVVPMLFVFGSIMVLVSDPPVALVIAATIVGLVSLIASLALGAWIQGRLVFSSLLYLEGPATAHDIIGALKASWEGTGRFQFSLAAYLLIFNFIVIISALLLCAPMIFVGLPLWIAAIAVAYGKIWPPLPDSVTCLRCGYDLQGIGTGPCPECGFPSPAAAI